MVIHAKGYAKWRRYPSRWECECGAALPIVDHIPGVEVTCKVCGRVWEYADWEVEGIGRPRRWVRWQPRVAVRPDMEQVEAICPSSGTCSNVASSYRAC